MKFANWSDYLIKNTNFVIITIPYLIASTIFTNWTFQDDPLEYIHSITKHNEKLTFK